MKISSLFQTKMEDLGIGFSKTVSLYNAGKFLKVTLNISLEYFYSLSVYTSQQYMSKVKGELKPGGFVQTEPVINTFCFKFGKTQFKLTR